MFPAKTQSRKVAKEDAKKYFNNAAALCAFASLRETISGA